MASILSDPQFRSSLPSSFHHGYASASYQIEGGYLSGGRGLSVWDEALKDQENGNEAVNSYEMWEEDVRLLKQYGASCYRFSISWSRVIPLGGKDDPVNPDGLEYYSKLIDALLAANITPFITLYHWDLPLELEKRYSGWMASKEKRERLLEDFENFADLLFTTYGNRCKNWITLNEPHINTMLHAACLKKDTFDMRTDSYIVGNNQILAHARAVRCYREKYQQTQKGKIAITLNCDWIEPLDSSPEAQYAAKRGIDLVLGWFADPIYLGKHNESVKQVAGDALEDFTEEEWKMIKGSSDFFGLNTYGAKFATGKISENPDLREFYFGFCEQRPEDINGKLIGRKGQNGHPYCAPTYFRKLLNYISDTWTGAAVQGTACPIICTENGWPSDGEAEWSLEKIVDDVERQEFYDGYIKNLILAIKEDGVVIEGYMAWSLLDNLEWIFGYNPRFGCTHVDRENGFKRTPKNSTKMMKEIWNYAKQK